MSLNTVWFILVSILFIGFFFLEGFDYGVGILSPFLGKEDKERRAILNTIGPHWNGNEVWMLTAGGAIFASFPHVYATLFSGAYTALILLLIVLILRAIALEFRSQYKSLATRKRWDWGIFIGSLLPALLWGVVVGNLMRGIPIDEKMYYWGGLLPLLNPYALLGGLVFVALFTLHGANFLSLKTDGEVRRRAEGVILKAWIVATVLTVLFVVWTFFATDILARPGGLISAILAAVALLATGYFARSNRHGWAFIMGSLTIALATIMVFAGLYPRILISTIDPDYNLTIYNAASSQYTLTVMTIVAIIFVPILLACQIWAYRVFRQRVTAAEPEKLIY
jgi:cytochrome d ubiquinol oxidase subunit II